MLGAQTYTVKRHAAGDYSTGAFVPGAESQFDVVGSVQPLSGSELLLLPEGERVRARCKMYSHDELKTASLTDKTLADRVVVEGRDLEVHSVSEFRNSGALSHFKYVLVAVGEDEQ